MDYEGSLNGTWETNEPQPDESNPLPHSNTSTPPICLHDMCKNSLTFAGEPHDSDCSVCSIVTAALLQKT